MNNKKRFFLELYYFRKMIIFTNFKIRSVVKKFLIKINGWRAKYRIYLELIKKYGNKKQLTFNEMK
jgi:hypothetical protein